MDWSNVTSISLATGSVLELQRIRTHTASPLNRFRPMDPATRINDLVDPRDIKHEHIRARPRVTPAARHRQTDQRRKEVHSVSIAKETTGWRAVLLLNSSRSESEKHFVSSIGCASLVFVPATLRETAGGGRNAVQPDVFRNITNCCMTEPSQEPRLVHTHPGPSQEELPSELFSLTLSAKAASWFLST